jgi:predicted nucleic acid-binding protein
VTPAPATCDTSVVVAALSPWHPDHRPARTAMTTRVRALPCHVLLECYSVLTRLPAPHRIAPRHAGDALTRLDVALLDLPSHRHVELTAALSRAGVRGGAVYDALIGATARHHGLVLLTLDQRARATYDVVGAQHETCAAPDR